MTPGACFPTAARRCRREPPCIYGRPQSAAAAAQAEVDAKKALDNVENKKSDDEEDKKGDVESASASLKSTIASLTEVIKKNRQPSRNAKIRV